jgi:hypothetical protein
MRGVDDHQRELRSPSPGAVTPMFVHSVYFWLRTDLSEQDQQTFDSGIQSLIGIDTVRHAFSGPPASTDRPIIDRTYSRALVLVFDNKEGHDAYQEHDLHEAFRQNCGSFWSDIKIYDCLTA